MSEVDINQVAKSVILVRIDASEPLPSAGTHGGIGLVSGNASLKEVKNSTKGMRGLFAVVGHARKVSVIAIASWVENTVEDQEQPEPARSVGGASMGPSCV